MDYETVIGLETHVQLLTNTKIFGSAPTDFGVAPNQNVDTLTLGLPGTLPVLNKSVVELAIKLGLALNCDIHPVSRFARKHYFYPDLPKGYQISQFDEPICELGHMNIEIDGALRTIGIKRIHMEEDAGKSIHDTRTESSLIDLNRAGVPLLEIVTEPDLRSPQEASAFLKTLRQIVRWLGVGDGNMEEGSLRCDANISLRPVGQLAYGTRTEIKNLNSFKFVERALEYEIARQLSVLKNGGQVKQETLSFDPSTGATSSLRSKEESSDYRYFPDPDLPPLVVEESWIARVRESLPKLPSERKQEMMQLYGLSDYDASVLTSDRLVVEYFEKAFQVCSNAKAVSNWITSELFGMLKKQNMEFTEIQIAADSIGELIVAIDKEVITGKMAKIAFEEMFKTGKKLDVVIAEKGLKQISSESEILEFIRQAFASNSSELEKFVAGNDRMLPFFMGQVMKLSKGNVNPGLCTKYIKQEIEKLRS